MPVIAPELISLEGSHAPLRRVVELLRAAGGRPYFVGGCVRDALMQTPVVDFDIEVYGLGTREIAAALRPEFGIITVGAAFGVTKVKDLPIDVSVPRRENRTGARHTDFEVQADPSMTPREAAERRDFTINAMMWDPFTGEIVDPWHGQEDLKAGVLRHVSAKFSEDPLRVLRAMQFVARFGFTVAPETIALCRSLSQADLPAERLFEEWSKLLLRGTKPSLGLKFLRDCEWTRFYPTLHAMIDVPQDPEWHPESCAYTHTALCLDAFARGRIGQKDEDLIVGLAVLLHDIGKATTTKIEPKDGRLHAYGHEEESFRLAPEFLSQITKETKLIEAVLPLVRWHAQPYELFRIKASDAAVRRLANKVVRIDRLIRVDEADRHGRGTYYGPEPSPQGVWLKERADALQLAASAPKRLVLGRHLIALGYKPAGWFSTILDEAFEAQLDGVFTDEATGLSWLQERMTHFKV